MKEWIFHRLSSIILIPACLLYPFYSNAYILLVIYLVLCYHILHGLLAIYDDYIQNEVYCNTAKIVTYLSIIFVFKVIVEAAF